MITQEVPKLHLELIIYQFLMFYKISREFREIQVLLKNPVNQILTYIYWIYLNSYYFFQIQSARAYWIYVFEVLIIIRNYIIKNQA